MAKTSQFKVAKSSRKPEKARNDIITDPRFTNIQTDPRFRLPSKKNSRVQIDNRFKHVLQDEAFSSRAKVDRYGRRLPKDAGKKELEKYYSFDGVTRSSSEDSKDDLDHKKANPETEKNQSSETEKSSSDDDSDIKESDGEEIFGFLDAQEPGSGVIPVGEVTSRIAVVNLDWDNIRAADLMAVFSSFVPATGAIKKISIYPSEFGKERMQREETEGPPSEIFSRSKIDGRYESTESSSEGQDDGGASISEENDEKMKKPLLQEDTSQDFDSAKLRRYQLERLRYYYSVIVCSSSSVARTIYEAIDGTEFLTTANFFDLRFIPDDLDFSRDEPRDECLQIPDGYRPNEFVTDALQHSKVRLTWDADDGTRKEAQKRAFSASRANIDKNDLKAYLGSDSSDDEVEIPEPVVVDATTADASEPTLQDQNSSTKSPLQMSKKDAERQRMRALLGFNVKPGLATRKPKSDPPPVGDLQITFSSGLTSSSQPDQSVFLNSPDDREETTVEKYVRKEKERKARRKSKLKALPEDTSNKAYYEDHEEDQGGFQDLGFADPFFNDPDSVKSTKTGAERKEAKRLKKAERAAEEATASAQRAELELLTMEDNAATANPAEDKRGVRHFDMKDIVKAEKASAKVQKNRGKQKRLSEREKAALKAKSQDAFRVDAQDPRFEAIYRRAEFAIDPSHPRYQATEGMQALLEEGRKKRKSGDSGVDEDEVEDRRNHGKRNRKGEDVAGLVAKMEEKSKR
ncbi:MAG: hypothetical protein Q9176_000889 [Flavoplaca citrina]